jgi:hypothetical protein
VANTVKRSLLIMATIMYFGNPVTVLNLLGIAMVMVGAFVYNQARQRYPPPAR